VRWSWRQIRALPGGGYFGMLAPARMTRNAMGRIFVKPGSVRRQRFLDRRPCRLVGGGIVRGASTPVSRLWAAARSGRALVDDCPTRSPSAPVSLLYSRPSDRSSCNGCFLVVVYAARRAPLNRTIRLPGPSAGLRYRGCRSSFPPPRPPRNDLGEPQVLRGEARNRGRNR
jgi:hypothetical protein